jgi:hypothetical protein
VHGKEPWCLISSKTLGLRKANPKHRSDEANLHDHDVVGFWARVQAYILEVATHTRRPNHGDMPYENTPNHEHLTLEYLQNRKLPLLAYLFSSPRLNHRPKSHRGNIGCTWIATCFLGFPFNPIKLLQTHRPRDAQFVVQYFHTRYFWRRLYPRKYRHCTPRSKIVDTYYSSPPNHYFLRN